MVNTLYYGDNLKVLRESIRSETVDLIYLDPPFNSNASYNVLFKSPQGQEAAAQIQAFDDTWHWGESAEEAYQDACLKALKAWPDKGPPRDPAAWLIFVGRNAALDGVRKRLDKEAGGRIKTKAFLSGKLGGERHALAGIGDPERFFRTLRALGLAVTRHPFPDHHAYAAADLDCGPDAVLLMTEKDAVKCAGLTAGEAWVLPVEAELPPALIELVLEKIRGRQVA